MEKDYAAGLDCVDLSTVLPKVGDTWLERFAALNLALAPYPVNPQSFLVEQAEVSTQKTYEGRSRFRMFWSLHSAIQSTRDKMVPGAMPLEQVLPKLRAFAASGPNLMLHQLFVEGLNDSHEEVQALRDLLKNNFPSQEIRVLRYNFCDRSPYREWDHIDEAVSALASGHERLKVQVSAGKEVAAACGQFLVAFPRSLRARSAVTPVPSQEHTPVKLGT
jgi:hypothetical protein